MTAIDPEKLLKRLPQEPTEYEQLLAILGRLVGAEPHDRAMAQAALYSLTEAGFLERTDDNMVRRVGAKEPVQPAAPLPVTREQRLAKMLAETGPGQFHPVAAGEAEVDFKIPAPGGAVGIHYKPAPGDEVDPRQICWA